jgi:hypothetical protein
MRKQAKDNPVGLETDWTRHFSFRGPRRFRSVRPRRSVSFALSEKSVRGLTPTIEEGLCQSLGGIVAGELSADLND